MTYTVDQRLAWAEECAERAVRYVDQSELAAAIEELAQGVIQLATAQAMSASGQDPKGLEAKPASAVAESDAP